MAALLVEAGGQLRRDPPRLTVERTLRLADQTVRSVAGQKMLVLRDTSSRCSTAPAPSVASPRATPTTPSSSAVRTAAHRQPASRLPRAGHPGRSRPASPTAPRSPAAQCRRTAGSPDRRLRRQRPARTRPVSPPEPHPERNTRCPPRPSRPSSSTRSASREHRLRHRRHRAVADARPLGRHLRAERVVLPLAEAVEAVGDAEEDVTGVVIRSRGLDAVVLLVFPVADAPPCAACSASRPAPRSASPR